MAVAARASALDLLARGAVSLKGRMPWSSNATFLVECALDETAGLAVYKPLRGERPLWDFPPGLYRREIAAYRLSEALGWRLVPLTVGREGPLGEGSLQLFVPADFEQHYFTLLERPEHGDRLQRICTFDLLLNNADRKSGHCLLGEDGLIWAIDNGLSFHVEEKLRTVIWDFGGTLIPDDLLADVRCLLDAGPVPGLAALLAPEEEAALAARGRALLEAGRFPVARSARGYPWPLV
jgi:uncharacterized repeat protein (TIGR03843 family)